MPRGGSRAPSRPSTGAGTEPSSRQRELHADEDARQLLARRGELVFGSRTDDAGFSLPFKKLKRGENVPSKSARTEEGPEKKQRWEDPMRAYAPSVTGDSVGGTSHASTQSWRSFASSRRSRDSYVSTETCGHRTAHSRLSSLIVALDRIYPYFLQAMSHMVPNLEEAVTSGSVVFFGGKKRQSGPNPPAVDISNRAYVDPARTEVPQDTKTESEEEFVSRLAEEISEKTARELDRHWYEHDEAGETETGRESIFDESILDLAGKEERYKKDHARLTAKRRGGQEQDAWELNRLSTAGLRRDIFDATLLATAADESRLLVSTKEARPDFLQGRGIVNTQSEVSVVRDPTSDMVVLAKKGSKTLDAMRTEAENSKLRERFWEMAGSTLGKVLGVTDDRALEDAKAAAALESDRPSASLGFALAARTNMSAYDQEKIRLQRLSLPITACKDQLLKLIREHPVVVIIGETGSGKTTQLTQILHEAGFGRENESQKNVSYGTNVADLDAFLGDDDNDDADEQVSIPTFLAAKGRTGLIGCTQPRRVAAVSVAKRVAEEFGCTLGREVGYAIRFEDCTSDVTRIKYMTDALLLREILGDPDLEKYSVIIMDEAHERSLATDVLFGLFRTLIAKRRDLKLIVTSATLNAEKFSNFFGSAPTFTIPGRTFPVKVEYTRSPVTDYVDGAVQKCLQVHCGFTFDPTDPSDILIFMTGQEDIEGACLLLSNRAETLANKMSPLVVLPIYSQLPADLQAKVFERGPHRKVIIATNIAETSLTLEGVRFVIDSGYCKLKVFSPRVGLDTLILTPISRANANQRSGRAGRTGPGICYRMYTEQAFLSEMLETPTPEIQRTNLANVVLLLKALQVNDVSSFDFMDPPSADTILNAMLQLWMLGALDESGTLTGLGKKMGHLPVDPSLAKMILVSDRLKCSKELLTVAAVLSVPSIFYRPKNRADEADAAREKFAVPESDHLTLLNIYTQWINNKASPSWTAKHFLHHKALMKVRSVRDQLMDIASNQRIHITACDQNTDALRKVSLPL